MFKTHGAISPWVYNNVKDIDQLLISDINGKITTSGKSISGIIWQTGLVIANRIFGSNSYGRLTSTPLDSSYLLEIKSNVQKRIDDGFKRMAAGQPLALKNDVDVHGVKTVIYLNAGITAVELEFLIGTTSNLQQQINDINTAVYSNDISVKEGRFSVDDTLNEYYLNDKNMLGLASNVSIQELDRLIGVNQSIHDKLDDLEESIQNAALTALEPLTIIAHAVSGTKSIRLKSNVNIQDLDHIIGTPSSIQAQRNDQNTSITSLTDLLPSINKMFNASIDYVHDNDYQSIRMPKDYTKINANKGIIFGSANKDYPDNDSASIAHRPNVLTFIGGGLNSSDRQVAILVIRVYLVF